MHKVLLALGSNHDAPQAMTHAIRLLSHRLTDLRPTGQLQTVPVGIDSCPFTNRLATGYTTEDVPSLITALKRIEYQCGNRKRLRKDGIIIMDIDLLLYDGTRYHPHDWERTYIQQLLSQTDIETPPSR